MEISRHIVSRFINHACYLIGRSKKSASLIIVEPEQHSKTYHLQQDEKEPIVVFQKEIQQISHKLQMLVVVFNNNNHVIQSEAKNLKNIHAYVFEILPPFSRLNDNMCRFIILSLSHQE
jgi:mevalonate pyrophosphate decarboxylase